MERNIYITLTPWQGPYLVGCFFVFWVCSVCGVHVFVVCVCVCVCVRVCVCVCVCACVHKVASVLDCFLDSSVCLSFQESDSAATSQLGKSESLEDLVQVIIVWITWWAAGLLACLVVH